MSKQPESHYAKSAPYSRTHDGEPWAWPLGELHTNTASQPAAPVTPALWPTQAGGLWLRCDAASHSAAVQALEACVLDVLLALPVGAAQVKVFDFAIRKRFTALAQLQPPGLYRLYSHAQQAQKGLEELEQLARKRHHHLLGDSPTLAHYNAQAARPEAYELAVINLGDFPTQTVDAKRLVALMQDAAAAGIWVLAISTTQPDAEPDETASVNSNLSNHATHNSTAAVTTLVTTALRASYPELVLTSPPGGEATLVWANAAQWVEAAPIEHHHDLHGLAQRLGNDQFQLRPTAPSTTAAVCTATLQTLRERAEQQHAAGAGAGQDFLRVEVGRTLDGRDPVYWRMGSLNDCYHALMLGMPGAGKSTLLNNLIVSIAEQYTAQEMRLYLMDYKDGVEFQAFEHHPNVEQIFLDNEDTAAASRLLAQFAATIGERNALFKSVKANIRNLADYNAWVAANPANQAGNQTDGGQAHQPLPRLMLIIDEVQRLLADTERTSAKFAQLLVDVTKRGRSAGIHIVLSTQSLAGITDINKLKAAISLRVSFMLNTEADATAVLEHKNQAPLHLSKYEFVINDASGKVDANQFGRGLPTPDVAVRIARARAARPARLCLTPVVVKSAADVVPAAVPITAVVKATSATFATSAILPPTSNVVAPVASVAEEDVLAKLARLRGIKPQVPIANS